LVLILGCGNSANTKKRRSTCCSRDSFAANRHRYSTGDNSSNALDWPGTYTGLVPCADCNGIETSITLNKELIYSIKTTYLGKKEAAVTEKKGSFYME